jgi:hypothetical protein
MLFVFVHLSVVAAWLGSMAYSLVVVQPRVARFFPDEQRREEFLIVLAHGNRLPVVLLIVAVIASALGVMVTSPPMVIGYAIAVVLYAGAGAVFADVSWRHWPTRVFALADELESFRRRLRAQAWAMFGLVATAFVIALSMSVWAGR